MKISLFALLSVAVIASSCDSPGEKTASQSQTNTQPTNTSVPVVNPAPVITPAGTTGNTTTTNNAATTTAAGMNPEHGKPGHRCDIPVGAPLSTPVQKPANNIAPTTITPPSPTVTTAPMVTPTNQGNTTTAVAPGMNPAHGQPGHRCDIPVGSPLNSKAATQTITTTPKSN